MHIWPVKVQAVAIAKPPFIDARARYKRMRQLEKEENRCMQLATGRKTILRDKHDRKKNPEELSFYMFFILFLFVVETWLLPIRISWDVSSFKLFKSFLMQGLQDIPPQLELSIWKLASHSDPPPIDHSVSGAEWSMLWGSRG